MRHGDEVAHYVEGQGAINGRADRLAIGVLQDGVTVGRRLRDRIGRDIAGRSRTILHDDRLAQSFGELGPHHAGERVDGPAGDEGDDDADRPARISLRRRVARMQRKHCEREGEPQPFHRITCRNASLGAFYR